jgi:hypothetical protein
MDKDPKWAVCKVLPTDYRDYGGQVERWKLTDISYPDCSCGCKHWVPLYDEQNDWADCDWGVCVNPGGPRAGLLTWEHQAGFKCFEYKKSKDDDDTPR